MNLMDFNFILFIVYNSMRKLLLIGYDKKKDLDTILINYYNDSVIINIEEPCEQTPLLGWKQSSTTSSIEWRSTSSATESLKISRKLKFISLKLFGIAFLLVGGLIIASYLLIIETRYPVVSFGLDLVNRDVWNLYHNLPMGNLLNHDNVLQVVVLQTGGKKCSDSESCIDLLQMMEEAESKRDGNLEIPYNFLIGGDGQTYEIRGWKHESGFQFIPKQSALVVGFIGDYTMEEPIKDQIDAGLSLISESLKRQKLQQSYKIYGVQNLTKSQFDGEALYNKISKWDNFDTLLKVL